MRRNCVSEAAGGRRQRVLEGKVQVPPSLLVGWNSLVSEAPPPSWLIIGLCARGFDGQPLEQGANTASPNAEFTAQDTAY